MYWSYSFDYDWLISPDSEWLKSPDANNIYAIKTIVDYYFNRNFGVSPL